MPTPVLPRHRAPLHRTTTESRPRVLGRSRELYQKYNKLASELEATKKIVFVGRLANYKYFDMDKAIDNALELFHRSAWPKLFTGNHFWSFKHRVNARMNQSASERRRLPRCPLAYDNNQLSTPFYPGEFGMELRVMVPWAYHQSQRCRTTTKGVVGSRYMYFFSDDRACSGLEPSTTQSRASRVHAHVAATV